MHRPLRAVSAAAAFTVAAALAALGAAPAAAAPSPPETGSLSWGKCPELSPQAEQSPLADRLQCATLRVPLDYENPDGRTIEVAVSRLRSPDTEKERGPLLLNPGGPGGAGLDLPVLLGGMMPHSVLDNYTLIGFDPRGVGHSSPVTCGLSPEQRFEALPWPLPGGVPENAKVARRIAEQCEQRSGDVLPYITTANTARDMDRIRAALGTGRISYLGYSYGTYLGAVYASLFPKRTDRFILDSSVSPSSIWRETFRAWGPATEQRFPDFARWAARRDPTYGLGSTPQQVRDTYFHLAAELDEQPLGQLTGNQFRALTRSALYRNTNFRSLARVWQSVERGNAEKAVSVARAAGLWPRVPDDNGVAAALGVVCGDADWPESVERYERDVRHDSKKYPIAGGMAANIWPCAFWPQEPREKPVEIGDEGPTNILILQNTRDPATPLFGAREMRKALGQRARMVTVDQGGHGVYLFTRNACAANAATAFLARGELPGKDAYCGATRATPRAETKAERQQRMEVLNELRSRQFPF